MVRDPGSLAGELGLISLFDIGQLLLLNRATGVMTVTSEGRRGSLWFRDGQLVNAIDEKQHDGEDAAFAVFAWRRGRFDFHGGPLPGAATIEGGTEAIMLEAARRIDEAGPEAGEGGVGSETAKLVEHQSKFDLLREEFTRVTRDASSEARGAPASEEAWLDALVLPGDRLLVREGAPARICSGNAWRPIGPEIPVEETTYRAFKARMHAATTLRVAGAPMPLPGVNAPATAAVNAARVRHRGRTLLLEIVAGETECLWLAIAAPPNPAQVRGPFELIDAVCSAPGLLLAAAPDSAAAHTLLSSLVARLSDTRGITTLIVTDDPSLAPNESAGVVITSSFATLDAAVGTTRPHALAIDARGAFDGRLLAACASVPIVLCAVVAADAESVIARWLLRFPASETARARVLVASMPVAIVLADATAHAEGTTTFTVQRVTRTGRPADQPVS